MLSLFKNKKSLIKVSLSALILTGIAFPAVSYAGNENYGFEFTIKSQQGNSRTAARYRETTTVNNAWKVNVTESGEGQFAITTFWLENTGGTNVSPSVGVAESEASKYVIAYDNASKTNVHLTAQNNNYNNTTYGLTGVWDEETGVLIY